MSGAHGLVVGRAGSQVFYLLEFGVSIPSPHVPGHPTSIFDYIALYPK